MKARTTFLSAITAFCVTFTGAEASFSGEPRVRRPALPAFHAAGTINTIPYPDRIASGDFDGDSLLDVAVVSARERAAEILFGDGEGRFEDQVKLELDDEVRNLAAGDLNGDRRDDLVLVSPAQRLVTVLISGPEPRRFHVTQRVRFEYAPDAVCIADLDHDGVLDIAVYGRKFLGVSILWGRGNGTFQRGQRIASNVTAISVAPAVISADSSTHLAILDWIGNRLILYRGLGRSFRQWGGFSFSEEPTGLLCTDANSDGLTDFVISFRDSRQVELYESDGLGEIRLTSTITPIIGVPVALSSFSTPGGGAKNGVICLTEQPEAVALLSLGNDARFVVQALYQPSGPSTDAVAAEFYRDSVTSIAVLSREPGSISFLRNNSRGVVPLASLVLAGGPESRSIVSADIEADSVRELCVLSEAAHAVYVYESETGESFERMWTFPLPESPRGLTWLGRPAGGGTFIAAHAGRSSVSATYVGKDGRRLRSVQIPVEGNPSVVKAEWNQRGGLRLIVASPAGAGVTQSLWALEEITQTKFVQQRIAAGGIGDVLSVAATQFRNGESEALSILSRDGVRDILSAVLREKKNSFGPPMVVWKLPPPATARGVVFILDEGKPVVVANLVSPGERLWTFVPGRDSLLVPVQGSESGVEFVSRDLMVGMDWNDDGVRDLVYINDPERRDLVVMYLSPQSRFDRPVRLLSEKDIGGMAVWGDRHLSLLRTSTNTVEFLSRTVAEPTTK